MTRDLESGDRALPFGVVLSGWRIVYVPVPKAACTSMLWTLADVQGEPAQPRDLPGSAAVTRGLLVHEPAFWRRTALLQDLPTVDWERVRGEDDWLVFTMTRQPVDRLWSAWLSKLLLREPRFVEAFSTCDWFPRVPGSPQDIVEDFRRFVRALDADPALLRADCHWQPQIELLQRQRIGFTHVGTTSAYHDTVRVLRTHLRDRGWEGSLTVQRENATLVGAGALRAVDDDLRGIIETLYAADMAAFGYPRGGPPSASATTGDDRLGAQLVAAARAIIARHERIGDLLALPQGSLG